MHIVSCDIEEVIDFLQRQKESGVKKLKASDTTKSEEENLTIKFIKVDSETLWIVE